MNIDNGKESEEEPKPEKGKKAWVVKTRHDWDVLYQESIVYYWNEIKDKPPKYKPNLYNIYKEMGVSNIIECPKSKKNEGSVLFYIPKLKETGCPKRYDAEHLVLKVIPEFIHCKPRAAKPDRFSGPINGWVNLPSKLVVKIPNRVLLNKNVAGLLRPFAISPMQMKVIKAKLINNQVIIDILSGDGFLLDKVERIERYLGNNANQSAMRNLLSLDYCCQRLLGCRLSAFYAFLPNKNKHNAHLGENGVIAYLIDLFEVGVILFKAIKAEHPESSGQTSAFDIVNIPELLVFLGIIERLVKKSAIGKQKVDIGPVGHNKMRLPVEFVMRKVEESVYTPLTTLLSSYISLGMFFPFGLYMEQNIVTRSNEYLAGLSAILDSTYSNPEKLNYSVFIEQVILHLFNSIQHSADIGESNNCSAIYGTPKVDPESRCNNSEASGKDESCNGGSADLSPGDRGGAAAINGDYAWEYFMPRVVAYNWQILNKATLADKNEIIKDNTPLLDYKAMLYTLGFSPPLFLDIVFELVDILPFKYTPNKVTESGYDVKFNFSAYISELSVAYPTPPEPEAEPFALSDLIARRANQPFTTG